MKSAVIVEITKMSYPKYCSKLIRGKGDDAVLCGDYNDEGINLFNECAKFVK